MLPKTNKKVRFFGSGKESNIPPHVKKRSRTSSSDSDFDGCEGTPSKRARQEGDRTAYGGGFTFDFLKVSFSKMAEWIVKKKQSFSDKFYLNDSAWNPMKNSIQEPSGRDNAQLPVHASQPPTGAFVERLPSYQFPTYSFAEPPGAEKPPNVSLMPDGHFKVPLPRMYPPQQVVTSVGHQADTRHMYRPLGHPSYSSTPRTSARLLNSQASGEYVSVYHKKFGGSVQFMRSLSQPSERNNRLAAKESIKLDEKKRYAELLQTFTSLPLVTALPVSKANCRRNSGKKGADVTVLGSSLIDLRNSTCEAKASTPVQKIEPTGQSHIVLRSYDLSDRSFLELEKRQHEKADGRQRSSSGQGARTKSPTQQHDLDVTVEIVRTESPNIGISSPAAELFQTALQDSKFASDDWVTNLRDKFSSDVRKREREINENLVKLEYFKEKKEEWEDQLEKRVRHRLSISEKEPPVVEDLYEEEEEGLPELTEEMEIQVDNWLRHRPPHEVLSDGFKLKITRADMATLAGLNWLNDEIVNFYMELIKARGGVEGFATVHCFNTFFYPKLRDQGHKGLRRWTKRFDIFSFDFILVPIHLGMHWCLAVIDIKNKAIRYFDSMGGKNDGCIYALKDYLQAESLEKKQQTLDMSDWKLENVKDIPQQMNGSDCGVFTCKYAEYVTKERKISFTQENMPYFRRRMVYEIVTQKLL